MLIKTEAVPSPPDVYINIWRSRELDYSEIFQLLSADCRTFFYCIYDKFYHFRIRDFTSIGFLAKLCPFGNNDFRAIYE